MCMLSVAQGGFGSIGCGRTRSPAASTSTACVCIYRVYVCVMSKDVIHALMYTCMQEGIPHQHRHRVGQAGVAEEHLTGSMVAAEGGWDEVHAWARVLGVGSCVWRPMTVRT